MGLLSLNSNIAALKAQRSLASSQDRLSQTLQRLSSGQRINSASDDAAGIAIADNLRAQSRLYGVANRNINDAFSAMNIISSTLDEQTTILQRLSELAEQSANGTLSALQRDTLNKEFQSLIKEFGRLGDSTQFNGVNLMLGGRGTNPSELSIQAGIDGSQNSNLRVGLGDSGSLSGTLNVDQLAFGHPNAFQSWVTANWGRTNFSIDELGATFGSAMMQTTGTDSSGRTREVLVAFASPTQSPGRGAQMIVFVQSLSDPTVWQNSINVTDFLGIIGDYLSVQFDTAGRFQSFSASTSGTEDATAVNLDFSGLVASGAAFGTSDGTSLIEAANVLTQAGARQAVDIISRRLQELSTSKGSIGAYGSRLQAALSVNSVLRDAGVAAESRIRDIDVATESARLVAERIKQQTAAQVLSMANQQPSIALALLIG